MKFAAIAWIAALSLSAQGLEAPAPQDSRLHVPENFRPENNLLK